MESEIKEIFDDVSLVYYEISKGKFSKPNYTAKVMLCELEENFYDKDIVKSDIGDILKDDKTENIEKLELIEEYFRINKLKITK